jgi:hypothetical protein
MRDQFHWARILSLVSGLVNQELLLRNEYLSAENRILRAHLPARLRLSDAGLSSLGEIAQRLGLKALQEIARGQAGYRMAKKLDPPENAGHRQNGPNRLGQRQTPVSRAM